GGNDPGDEVGQEHEALDGLLEPCAPHLGNQDCRENRKEGVQDKEHEVVEERVRGDGQGLAGLEKELEVLEVVPGTAQDAVPIIELLERKDDAPDGQIGEQDEVQAHGYEHEVESLVPAELVEEPPPMHERSIKGVTRPALHEFVTISTASLRCTMPAFSGAPLHGTVHTGETARAHAHDRR